MVGVIFPGQGSQAVGMLSAYAGVPGVAAAVAEASAALNIDLAHIIEHDETALNQTINTQPAMLAVGVGVYRAVSDSLPAPRIFAGHSLGEYAALVCAKSLTLAAAAKLVYRRAQHMQNAVADGGMLAVLGADAETIQTVCADLRTQGEQVWAANENTSSQIVLAGLKPSLQRAADAVKAAGAKRAVMLPMSVPSHCPLLAEAARAYEQDLRAVDWQPPITPIIHNAATAFSQPQAGDTIADFMCKVMADQLTQPVRWTAILQKLAAESVGCVYESGPGKVLANLGKKSDLPHIVLDTAAAVCTVTDQTELGA